MFWKSHTVLRIIPHLSSIHFPSCFLNGSQISQHVVCRSDPVVDFYWLKTINLILATVNWFRSGNVVWSSFKVVEKRNSLPLEIQMRKMNPVNSLVTMRGVSLRMKTCWGRSTERWKETDAEQHFSATWSAHTWSLYYLQKSLVPFKAWAWVGFSVTCNENNVHYYTHPAKVLFPGLLCYWKHPLIKLLLWDKSCYPKYFRKHYSGIPTHLRKSS